MTKTLKEDGYDVTLYERRSKVGGLWAYSEDTAHTIALPSAFAFDPRPSRMLSKHDKLTLRQERAPTSANSHADSVTFPCQTVSSATPL